MIGPIRGNSWRLLISLSLRLRVLGSVPRQLPANRHGSLFRGNENTLRDFRVSIGGISMRRVDLSFTTIPCGTNFTYLIESFIREESLFYERTIVILLIHVSWKKTELKLKNRRKRKARIELKNNRSDANKSQTYNEQSTCI